MKIIRDIEQGTPEWQTLRAGVVTASRFSEALAKGRGSKPSIVRRRYAYEIATERLTGRPAADDFQSQYMARGNEREPEARALYEFRQDREVEQVAFVLRDDGLVGCSPDGLVGDDGLIEIKAPKLSTHCGYLLSDELLIDDYAAQVQGQLYVCEREWCDVVSYCPESHIALHIRRAHRDEKAIKSLELGLALFLSEVDELTEQLRKAA